MGWRLFQELSARGLFLSGTHRCASSQRSPCSGTTTACDAAASPYRISDVAHFDLNFFQTAHQATLGLAPPPLVISVHGYSYAAEPDITLSDGTRTTASETDPVNRLRNALQKRGVGAYSCNRQEGLSLAYCGTTNVQGRLSNRSAQPCSSAASGGSGLFIHMEQKLSIRTNPEDLAAALQEAIPAEFQCDFGAISSTFFPQIAVGGGYETTIGLVNAVPLPAGALLTFTDADGNPLQLSLQGSSQPSGAQSYRAPLLLNPWGRATVSAAGAAAAPVKRGWARVDACAVPLHGVATYRSMDGAKLKDIIGVLDSPQVQAATMLVDSDDTNARYTGFAVANPGSSDITISLHVVRADGTLDRILTPPELNPLKPGVQIAKFLHEFDPALIQFQGSLVMTATGDQYFVVMALVEHQGQYTAVPVISGGSPPQQP